nr:RluA family pseudouridine synthase [Oscillospiraceae bacterium]
AGYLISTSGSGICHAVNRLDRDTSGVVLFAKNSHMKALLSASLKDERSCKEYIAVADGVFSPLSGTIDLPIKRLNERDMLRITAPDGQRAVTNYVTLCSSTIGGHAFSVLKLKLETGRTHQIRVHCSSCGHPVVGDALYSTASSEALSGELNIHMQALHAYRLSFIEPLTKKELEIVAPVTRSDMLNIIAPLQFEY